MAGSAAVRLVEFDVREKGTEIWNWPPKAAELPLWNQFAATELRSTGTLVLAMLNFEAAANVKFSVVRLREVATPTTCKVNPLAAVCVTETLDNCGGPAATVNCNVGALLGVRSNPPVVAKVEVMVMVLAIEP